MENKESRAGISGKLTKRLLSIASLFESEFYVDWIQELADVKTRQALSVLENGELQSVLTKTAPGCFRFVDEQQRLNYFGLLEENEIAELRQSIVSLLMTDILDEKEAARQVSSHLLQMHNSLAGCRILFRAAEQFRKTYMHEKAIPCYRKIIDNLSDTRSDEADWLYTEAAIGYSKISEAAPDFSDVIEKLHRAGERAEALGNLVQRALLSMHLAKNEWLSSNYDEALKQFEQGLTLFDRVDDPRLKRATIAFRTFFSYWQARYAETVALYESSVPEVEQQETRIFPLLASEVVAVCYTAVGQVTQGLGMLDALLSRCRSTGEAFVASYAAAYICSIMFEFGSYDKALQYHAEALEFAAPYRNHLMKTSLLLMAAVIHHRQGDPKQALYFFEQYLQKEINPAIVGVFIPYYLELCWAVAQGELPAVRGLDPVSEIRKATTNRNALMQGVGYRYLALMKTAAHPPETSDESWVDDLQRSMACLETTGHRLEQARTRVLLAKAHLAAGEGDTARDLIQDVLPEIDLYGEQFVPPEIRFLIRESRSEKSLLAEIMKLSQEIVSIRDNTELVSKILSTTSRLTSAERGAIFNRRGDPAAPDLVLGASKNLLPDDIVKAEFDPCLKLIREAAQSGRGQIYVNAETGHPFPSGSESVRSAIAVPMILRGQVAGVLYHDNRVFSNIFRESDFELLDYFSAMAAITMDNVRAYKEIRQLYNHLEEEKQYYVEQHLESLHFEEFVGKSQRIREVFSAIDRVAATEANVMILGETGVGKELVARAIHRNSPRRDKPFVRVNCSALPDTLVTSELFGHEKGAFTGAVDRKIGRFELADGGTLFLDEIGDISLDVQVQLLRVLQSKEFERLGGKTTLRSNFRLVTATNRDLRKMVKRKSFRQDLFYRLNVFPIHIPTLTERREDIPLLVQHFLKIYGSKTGRERMRISERDMQRLMDYHWPGNIRELENIIERGVILSRGDQFRLPELSDAGSDETASSRILSMEEMERQHVLRALTETNWKIRGPGGTAEMLKMHPSTLYSRIKKLGLKKPAIPPRT